MEALQQNTISSFLEPATQNTISDFLKAPGESTISSFINSTSTNSISEFIEKPAVSTISDFLKVTTPAQKTIQNFLTAPPHTKPVIESFVDVIGESPGVVVEVMVQSTRSTYTAVKTWIYDNWRAIMWKIGWGTAIILGVMLAWVFFFAGSWGLLLAFLKYLGYKLIPGALWSILRASGINVAKSIGIDKLSKLVKKNKKIQRVLESKVPDGYLRGALSKVGVDVDNLRYEDVAKRVTSHSTSLVTAYLTGGFVNYAVSTSVNVGIFGAKKIGGAAKNKAVAAISSVKSAAVKVKENVISAVINPETTQTPAEVIVQTAEVTAPREASTRTLLRRKEPPAKFEVSEATEEVLSNNKKMVYATVASAVALGLALVGAKSDVGPALTSFLKPLGENVVGKMGDVGRYTFDFVKESTIAKNLVFGYLIEKVGIGKVIDAFSDKLLPGDLEELKTMQSAYKADKTSIKKFQNRFLSILMGRQFIPPEKLSKLGSIELRKIFLRYNPGKGKIAVRMKKADLQKYIVQEQSSRMRRIHGLLTNSIRSGIKMGAVSVTQKAVTDGYAYAKSTIEELDTALEQLQKDKIIAEKIQLQKEIKDLDKKINKIRGEKEADVFIKKIEGERLRLEKAHALEEFQKKLDEQTRIREKNFKAAEEFNKKLIEERDRIIAEEGGTKRQMELELKAKTTKAAENFAKMMVEERAKIEAAETEMKRLDLQNLRERALTFEENMVQSRIRLEEMAIKEALEKAKLAKDELAEQTYQANRAKGAAERDRLRGLRKTLQTQKETAQKAAHEAALKRLSKRQTLRALRDSAFAEALAKKADVVIVQPDTGVSHPLPPEDVIVPKPLQDALDWKFTPLAQKLAVEGAKHTASWIPGIGWAQGVVDKVNLGLDIAEQTQKIGKVVEVLVRLDRGENPAEIVPTAAMLDGVFSKRLPSLNDTIENMMGNVVQKLSAKEVVIRVLKDKILNGWDNNKVAYEIGKKFLVGEGIGADTVEQVGLGIWGKISNIDLGVIAEDAFSLDPEKSFLG